MSPDLDVELLAAVNDAVSLIMRAALTHGPLPSLRSPEFITAPPEVRLAVLAVGGSSYVFAEDTLNTWLTEDYIGGRYHRAHALPAYAELQRLRYPPNGDRDEWIRYGDDGPPADLAAVA